MVRFVSSTPVRAESSSFVAAAGAPERNLVLVHRPGSQDVEDFHRIGALVRERAPDIEAFIARADSSCPVTTRKAARRPSLVFSPTPLARFRPRRGKVYAGKQISKLDQMRRLQAAGVMTPDAVSFDDKAAFDPSDWGELTVLKPNLGKSGEDVFVYRTHEMQFAGQELWPANDPRRRSDMLAQKFIDTGTHPAKYRMLVLFGRPLYCEEQVSRAPSPPIEPKGSGPIEGFVTSGASTAATAGTRRTRVCYDADVLALAPRTAAAFPEVPVLALDILREAATGRLYVLETNPTGYTWHLSSRLGKIAQQRLGIDRYAQFDALSVAADALIERTRAEAML
jgi:hypothetical protein